MNDTISEICLILKSRTLHTKQYHTNIILKLYIFYNIFIKVSYAEVAVKIIIEIIILTIYLLYDIKKLK